MSASEESPEAGRDTGTADSVAWRTKQDDEELPNTDTLPQDASGTASSSGITYLNLSILSSPVSLLMWASTICLWMQGILSLITMIQQLNLDRLFYELRII